MVLFTPIHVQSTLWTPELPKEVTLEIRCDCALDFIYYAIAGEQFGEVETFYEYTMEEGADGHFQIVLPRPPNPLGQWTIMICGYHNGTKVLDLTKDAAQVF